MPILASTDSEVASDPVGINHIWKKHRPARAKILIGIRFRYGVVHRPIIGHLEGVVCSGKLYKTVSKIPLIRKPI
jgi:hypothetical protein